MFHSSAQLAKVLTISFEIENGGKITAHAIISVYVSIHAAN